MSTALLTARTVHARLSPFRHRFVYRLWMLRSDIDGPPDGPLFRSRLLHISARDHAARDGTPMRPWVEARLAEAGLADCAARVELVAMPRVLGYTFNPISLFLCHRADGTLGAVIYEVKNTFGDQHAYVARIGQPGTATHAAAKRMHVSPFFDMQGGYRFALGVEDDRFNLVIRYGTAAEPRLVATLSGAFTPAGTAALLRAMARVPFVTLKVITLIHWHALILWRRGARFHSKPEAPPAIASSTHEPA
jgi:uncharacterized protein